jgi:hypothetical protein
MKPFAYPAGIPGAAVAATLAFPSPVAAAALMPPRPEQPSRTSVVVQRVEVPVPVDDITAEIVQMQLAAAAAAVTAAAVTKARLRRRYDRPASHTIIDITDPHLLDTPPKQPGRA